MKRKRLKGDGPSAYDMNMALFGHGDPDMLNLTSEQKANLFCAAMLDNMKPVGKVIMMGTGGDISDRSEFVKLWNGK